MKKVIALVLSLALAISVSTAFAAETVSIIGTPNPHIEILEAVKDDMAALGYELDLIVTADYTTENPATMDGSVMANFFQHIPYLEGYNKDFPEEEQLVPVVFTHFEPMAIYPGTKTSLDDIAEGDKILVPNDAVNENRALMLLEDAGLITLPEGTTLESLNTKETIAENPYNLEIVEVAAEQIPGLREDAAYAVINGNNATLVDLVPYVDGLYAETADSEAAQAYVNVIVVKPENAEADWVKALEQVIYTQKVYDLIVESGFAPTFEVPAAARKPPRNNPQKEKKGPEAAKLRGLLHAKRNPACQQSAKRKKALRSGIASGEPEGLSLVRHFTMSDLPVISAGTGIPMLSSIVGAISARRPPSRSFLPTISGPIAMKGTGLVV